MKKGQGTSPRRVLVTRGPYSIGFQMARSFITAAAASVSRDQKEAAGWIDVAIGELQSLKKTMLAASEA